VRGTFACVCISLQFLLLYEMWWRHIKKKKRIESANPGWPGEIYFLVADSSQVVKCFDRNVKRIEEHNASQTFNSQMNVS
jgi:hypothetical protein